MDDNLEHQSRVLSTNGDIVNCKITKQDTKWKSIKNQYMSNSSVQNDLCHLIQTKGYGIISLNSAPFYKYQQLLNSYCMSKYKCKLLGR